MRRGLGRGRLMIGSGAVLALVGMFLPWFSLERDPGLPVITSNGFDGAAILLFVAAVGLLALLLLPYASASGRSPLDHASSYVLLVGLAVVGLLVAGVQLWSDGALGIWPPDRCPGLWLAAIGTLLIAWGVAEVLGEEQKARSDGLRTSRMSRRR